MRKPLRALLLAPVAALLLFDPAYAAAVPPGASSGGTADPLATPPLLEPEGCKPGGDSPCPAGEEPKAAPEASAPSPSPSPKAAPSFTLKDLDGKPRAFEPRPGMKPALLIFWSTFCGSCIEEMPVFAKVLEPYQGSRLQVLTVDLLPAEAKLDEAARRQLIRRYFAQHRIRMPVVLDRKAGREYVAAGPYRVTGTPTLFLIGSDGAVRWTKAGRVDPEVLEGEIKRVIRNP